MKRYVIQSHVHNWDPWEVCPGKEFFSLEEAMKAFEALPVKRGRRIAERYTQVRYKAVKTGAPEPLTDSLRLRHPSRREKTNKTRKKRPPEGWHLRAVASRACAEKRLHDYYSKFSAECKPQSGQEGRDFPRVLGIYAYGHWLGFFG